MALERAHVNVQETKYDTKEKLEAAMKKAEEVRGTST